MIPLEIVDTNGNRYTTGFEKIKHTLFIKDKKFFKALISPNAFCLGEAYIKGYFDISGNIRDLYEQVSDRLLNKDQPKNFFGILSKLWIGPNEQEQQNIEYHYNVPSEFYRTFLGRTMGYTCGYYSRPDTTMDQAQIEKMDIICKKLDLSPGENLLDIGCGWGNLLIHAVKHYHVKGTGITLSTEQKEYAEEWIANKNLQDKIEIKLLNYRDLGEDKFDKISCVGMSEHVGRIHMDTFFKTVYRSLKTGGLFMQHTITTNKVRSRRHENSFLDKYMFPGGELMLEHELVDMATSNGFELINAENFRPHYVRTLNDWIIRMEKHKKQLCKIVAKKVYRIYYIFFIGSVIAFKQKEISLFQNLFYKTASNQEFMFPFHSAYASHKS